MDPLRDRVDALTQQLHTLQQQTHALQQQTHTVTRRLRWWRGLACGLVGLAGLAWMLPAVIAQEDAADNGPRGLAPRVAALESLLKHFSREGNDLTIKEANLHIVNGLGQTACGSEEEPIPDCPNGLGNLIVGYNELRAGMPDEDIRTGSHNVVVGRQHNFSRFGGLVVGSANTISGDFAVVSGGGPFNTASGPGSVVSGGGFNIASGEAASVSGGTFNIASNINAVVSGGANNTASGLLSSVSGGSGNTASGEVSTVSGGGGNTASGHTASVNGGITNTASGDFSSVSGGGENTASGGDLALGFAGAAVSGGSGNTASGSGATVSGGQNRTAEGEFDWVAGSLFEDD